MPRNEKRFAYLTMIAVVFIWGFDYVLAKIALAAVSESALICMKFAIGAMFMFLVKCRVDRHFPFSVRDLPMLILCVIIGELLYYYCEYKAMDFLPVALISIVLCFVPIVSVVLEYIIYKRKANLKIGIGIAAGIVGVVFVLGGDISGGFAGFKSGQAIGYALALTAVFAWNGYNFLTKKLIDRYKPLDMAMYQAMCTAAMTLPLLLGRLPKASAMTGPVVGSILFIGIVCEGLAFMCYINALDRLGPTPCSLFSNMLPVTTTFFGWLFLGEFITPVQIFGGIIVVGAGTMVICEKDKLDKRFAGASPDTENGE